MLPYPIIYHVLYTSGHPWDHQFSTILGAKMPSKRWSKQICQKSLGKWLQSSTRSAQSSAKVAQKPPRWVQDGVRKPMKIDKKVMFEVVCQFGRYFGVILVLWGCLWDTLWLQNQREIISRRYTRTRFLEQQISKFAMAAPFRTETKTNKKQHAQQASATAARHCQA